MPESLTNLLQQHVDQLSRPPAGGFSGVRAKARRRSQRRIAAASLATVAVVTLGAVLGNAALSDHKHLAPTKPVPTPIKAATLLDTHWQFTSVTTNGKTLALDDTQDYLTMSLLGGWMMREHCQNISGGMSLGQQVQLSAGVQGTAPCRDQPLPTAVTQILHSPLTDTIVGQALTLSGATGSMSFTAQQLDTSVAPAAMMTDRIWRLVSFQDSAGNHSLDVPPSPGKLWLSFGRGGWLGDDECNIHQGAANVVGRYVDFTGAPGVVASETCSKDSANAQVAKAYDEMVKDGRLIWAVTGGKLELTGLNLTLDYLDAGPASALCAGACAPSAGS